MHVLLLTGLNRYTEDLLGDSLQQECPVVFSQYLKLMVTLLHWKECDHALTTYLDQQF